MAARFPRGKQPEFPRALHWDKNVIQVNQILISGLD